MTSELRTHTARNATERWRFSDVRAQFLLSGAICLLGLAVLSSSFTGGLTTSGTLVAIVVYLSALGFGMFGLRSYPHPSIGACNVATLVRLILVATLIAILITPAVGPWTVFGVAGVALALDGVDGWLARRGGHVSDFGAQFDMEVDAVLALVLACHAYFGGQVGAFVLLLGLPRYVFWVAQIAFPWLNGDLPPRFSRKVVCVVQIAILIIVVLPIVERLLADWLAAVAALLLIWSFSVDIRWLWLARK